MIAMPRYHYKAMTMQGETVSAEIDAASDHEFNQIIEDLGLILISKTILGNVEIQSSRSPWPSLFKTNPSSKDVTEFLRNFSALLNASIRLDQALDMLSQKEFGGAMMGVASALRQSILSGQALSDALSMHPDYFSPSMIALISISEKSGTLPRTLAALAEKREREEKLKQKAIDSLSYPLFLIVAVSALFIFFVLFVLPQFKAFVVDMVKNADPILVALIGLSDFLTNNGLLVVICFVSLTIFLIVMIWPRQRRHQLMSTFLRLPGLRGLYRDYRTAQFCRNFGLLADYGLTMAEAIELAGAATGFGEQAIVFSLARDKVRQGQPVGLALEETGALAPIAIRMLRVGEESGLIADLAKKTADLFEARVERQFQRVVDLVGPIAILLVSLLVGGLIFSIMTALLSVNQLVG